jgi:hypothetical protein
MEFSITEELATLMLTKKVITVTDLHNEVEMVLQNPDIPTQNLSFKPYECECLKMTNVVAMASKLFNFIRSKENKSTIQ